MNYRHTSIAGAMATVMLLASSSAVANEPTMTILEPTGTVYVAAFPASVPFKFRVGHDPLNVLNVLDVDVDGVSIIGGPIGNPFAHGGGPNCTSINSNGAFTSCAILGTEATLGLNMSVPAPGAYSLLVTVKHRGDEGSDTETVQFLTLNVEHPAPPAVANAYMNANNPPKSKVRGCVISAIAELHAKDSYYGPKGGPYDNALIRADVDEFRVVCGG